MGQTNSHPQKWEALQKPSSELLRKEPGQSTKDQVPELIMSFVFGTQSPYLFQAKTGKVHTLYPFNQYSQVLPFQQKLPFWDNLVALKEMGRPIFPVN